jgi:Tannase and feruloyl esterase
MKHASRTILILTGLLGTARVAVLATAVARSPSRAIDSCESLRVLKMPDTTITLAERVAAGAFRPPEPYVGLPWTAGPRGGQPVVAAADLAAFCRVVGVIRPSTDSEIGFEMWLPSTNWNRKFMGVGNGGFAGDIDYLNMSSPFSRGYATMSTDTGYRRTGPQTMQFMLHHPQKLIDFGYRAVHENTVKGKLIVAAFYSAAPAFSYWHGSSQGGRQALMEAQRFPADYDGIIVGNPVSNFDHLQASHLNKRIALDKNPSGFVSPEKLAVIHDAVLKACDALDGVKDGVLEDPTRCDFDPASIECKGADETRCLTPAQVAIVRTFYNPTVNPRTKETIYPGLERGGEPGWSEGMGHMRASRSRAPGDYLQFALFQNPAWDYKTFDFDRDMANADRLDGGVVAAVNPDLHAFFERGGKLLQHHGWSDPSVSPRDSINYYTRVREAYAGRGRLEDSYRLFMAPGMGHSWGGDGPNAFDPVSALEQWVEHGTAPDRIVASLRNNGKVERTRPLCPYPQIAHHNGTGSTDAADNFICRSR